MALTKEQIAKLSDELLKATSTSTPITNIVDQYPDITIDEAYEVQLQSYRTRIKNGDLIVGRKVGLSAKKMQEMFNVDEPVFGHLFASMMVPEGVPVSKSRLCKGSRGREPTSCPPGKRLEPGGVRVRDTAAQADRR